MTSSEYVQIVTLGHKMGSPRGHIFSRCPSKDFLSATTRARALIFGMKKMCVEGGVGSCYALKDCTTEETSLIALHQMV